MRTIVAFALALVMLGGFGASDSRQPDSLTQPLKDGCNRSQVVLLAEAAADLAARDVVTPPQLAPEWVYVGGDATPRTAVGKVVAAHTAGQDLFGDHRTYDLNVDVALPKDSPLLSTRNAKESPPQIHTEWETGLVPLWAWPSVGDTVRETGSFIWDCGHWQLGSRKIPESDLIPGDPLGTAGVETIGGEEAEIHPIAELATWRSRHAFVLPNGAAVAASELDVYISNQGGGAKAVEECALSPTNPAATVQRLAANGACSQLQTVAGRDYTYDVPSPPRPARSARLHVLQVPHTSNIHNAPRAASIEVRGSTVHVTVPFSRVKPSTALQDFGTSVYVWWTPAPDVHRFRIALERLRIYNNLDGDAGSRQENPEVGVVSPNGEWNVFVDLAGQWRALHQEMKAVGAGDLENVGHATPSAPVTYDLTKLRPSEVAATGGESLSLATDARDCDEPGFTDCPADRELDFSQHPGRAMMLLPVSALVGKMTTVTLHPAACSNACTEDASDPACGSHPCYDLTLTITDLGARRPAQERIEGDGRPRSTLVNGTIAFALPWWRTPPLGSSPDQDEEAVFLERLLRRAVERWGGKVPLAPPG